MPKNVSCTSSFFLVKQMENISPPAIRMQCSSKGQFHLDFFVSLHCFLLANHWMYESTLRKTLQLFMNISEKIGFTVSEDVDRCKVGRSISCFVLQGFVVLLYKALLFHWDFLAFC